VGVVARGTAYAAAATLTLAGPTQDDLVPVVAALTGGTAIPILVGEDWVDLA
jgi:hypothetical protein